MGRPGANSRTVVQGVYLPENISSGSLLCQPMSLGEVKLIVREKESFGT